MLHEISFSKISSKGQMVIPKEFRDKFQKGDKIIIIEQGDSLIIKNAKQVNKLFEEDIKFAKEVEKGWTNFEEGNFYRAKDENSFINDIKKW